MKDGEVLDKDDVLSARHWGYGQVHPRERVLESELDASNFDLEALKLELEACSPVEEHSFPWRKVSRSQTNVLDYAKD